ncbi:MAG TPA: hypothetical protein VK932_09060 [Kofleriaceae bacterium]|nr:hypothetical protein [Kofleriaceae bacterium]
MRSRPPTDQQRTAIHDPERAPGGQGAGAEIARPYDSQPIRVISLKAPGEASEDRLPLKQHRPRLRRLSEVAQRARVATPPGGLGYLAPPRDPREARTRRLRDYVLWGSVVVILASGVTIAVWFLAGA